MLSRLRRAVRRAGVFLVDDVTMSVYLCLFGLAVVGFAVLYTVLTPFGHGIGTDHAPLPDASFLTGLYFSIVTISSLGYSYMHPMGASKALASFEVLLGLATVGIMIAKVTSRRLSYHVSRLFSSDAQAKLENTRHQFASVHSGLSAAMTALAEAYPSVPRAPAAADSDRDAATGQFRRHIADLRTHCSALRDYLSAEIEQGHYFEIVPRAAVLGVGNSLDRAFWVLGQLITSLSAQARTEILDTENRQRISEALELQERVCILVAGAATNAEIVQLFERIRKTCKQVPSSYFAIPEERQPDQTVQVGNEPQAPAQTNG